MKIVYIEPEDNFLNYASVLARRLVEGEDVVEIKGSDAYPSNIREVILREEPEIVWGCGHGKDSVYTVQAMDPFLRTGDNPLNLDISKDKTVHLLSCLTARELGPSLVDKGADDYIGYNDEFYLGIKAKSEPYPVEGEEASSKQDFATNILCDLEAQRVILEGGTVEEAYRASQARFDEEIDRYESGDRSDWYIAPVMARSLFHNKKIQRIEGAGIQVPVYQNIGVYAEDIIKIGVPAGFLALGGVLLAMSYRK